MKYILIIVAGFILSSCASSQSKAPDTTGYGLRYAYYSENQNKLAGHVEPGMRLVFPAIPGKLFGVPTRDLVYTTVPESVDRFSLILPANMDSRAAKLDERSLKIEPSHTKLVRLGTFHILPRYKEDYIGGGGFRDGNNGNHYILVYFSGAAELTGQLVYGAEVYSHNIVVNKGGWHWIQISKTAPDVFELTAYSGDTGQIELFLPLVGAIDV
ncbi:MAG TPA: hypothetical protein VF268_06755 [Gammaproteobacteria bacterium]